MENWKEEKAMNFTKLTLTALLSFGAVSLLPFPVKAQDGILFRLKAGSSNYCHLKFPAIREETLDSNRPVLKDAKSADIIDFYGPCDYDPTGKAAVAAQKLDNQHRRMRAYSD